ncbi:MAG: GNAT family protein [Candidatus Promineifilaceae bacterium]|nr:GNAT family protein [Candidatus Promineifilaceae bacterium]
MPPRIQTARLLLRPWEFTDLEAVLEYAQDEAWARFLPVPRPYRREHAREFLARQILLDRAEHASWAIMFEEKTVGGINLRFSEAHRIAEMGYSIARPLWGRGLTTEAAAAVRDAAFTTYPELERVRAMADSRNRGSRRVMEKIGMQHEGTLRRNRLHQGELVDEAWYGILRSEWEARRQSVE